MRDFIRPAVKLAIAIAIMLVIVNDVAAVFSTYWHADEIAQSVANQAAQTYKLSPQQWTAWTAADNAAKEGGAKLTGFSLVNGKVTVNIEVPTTTIWMHYIPPLRQYLIGKTVGMSDI